MHGTWVCRYGAVEQKGTAGDMRGNSLSSARDVRLEGRVRVWILQGILDFRVGILSDKKTSGQLIPQVQWVQNPFYRFKSFARLPLDGHMKQGKERKLRENKKKGPN